MRWSWGDLQDLPDDVLPVLLEFCEELTRPAD